MSQAFPNSKISSVEMLFAQLDEGEAVQWDSRRR